MTAALRRWGPAAVLLALLAYLPPLLTAPGWVPADTKHTLFLDPGQLLRSATSLWDPGLYGGWVTHQTIGYLWPMGPWFWALDALGLPDWVAQRLWVGTLLLAAGSGMAVAARVLRCNRAGAVVAGLAYMLSPYLLGYVQRTSVLLAPWAGLGWMLALAVLAVRRGGWRYPALFALVVLSVGSINATALVLCGLGPVLWMVNAAWIARTAPVGRVLAAAGRIGLLSAGVSAWWAVALAVQSRYGADVLAYSETVEAVSTTALASEGLRGLGYWLFYGGDVLGPWNSASTPYLQNPGLLALGFGLVAVSAVAVVTVRWAERTFLAAILLTGIVIAVGAHLWTDPSPFGRLLEAGADSSTLVVALRSSTRALPLVLAALALGLGALVTALAGHGPRLATVAAAGLAVLIVANLPSLWNGTLVDDHLRRPEDVPAWWPDAAGRLDGTRDTRLLELPGQEFAAYRWGTTNDPVVAGLTDRPSIVRDLLPLGPAASMDLLYALDGRFQDGVGEWAAVAPVARLLGVGDVVVRGDAAFERYRTPRPELTWEALRGGPPGLGPPETFGSPTPNEPAGVPMLDETALAEPAVGTPVPPVAVVPVAAPLPTVRTHPAAPVTLVAGSGEGLVDAAAAGLLEAPGAVRYSASFTDPDELVAAAGGATLLVTDTNRKRATQWRGTQDVHGLTEDAGDGVLERDSADARLPVFPGAGPDTMTLAEQRGGARVVATSYGEPTAYRPEDRALHALDGDPATAWRVGDRGEALGARLRIELDEPADPGTITIQQLPEEASNRAITAVAVRSENGRVETALDASSQRPPGQAVPVAPGPTSWIEIEVTATSTGRLVNYFGVGPVGIAEVGVAGIALDEVVRPPTALLDTLGAASTSRPLGIVLTRWRVDPRNRWRSDPEPNLVRALQVPAARAFALDGTARLAARADDATLVELLAGTDDVVVTADRRLTGVPSAWGRAAVDGDPTTAWTTPFGAAEGATLRVRTPEPITFDRLDLAVLADGRHSVPVALTVSAGGETREVALPEVPYEAGAPPRVVPVTFPALTGDSIEVTVTATRPVGTIDRRYGDAVALPVGIAEVGLPGVRVDPLPARLDTGCRDDLVRLGDEPVAVRVSGDSSAVLAGERMRVEPCDGEVVLGPGEQVLRTTAGTASGLDIDRLVLRSDAGGEAGWSVPDVAPGPAVRVVDGGRWRRTVEVTGADAPFWLVLAEGHSDGWRARAGDRDLGAPELVDGGGNGWLVEPGAAEVRITLEWRPQRWVIAGLALSLAAVVACLVLVVAGRPRRAAVEPPPPPVLTSPFSWPGDRMPGAVPLVVAVVAGLVTALFLHPAYGAVVVPAVAASTRWPRARFALTVSGVWCMVLIGLFAVARQVVSRPLEGFGWVTRFEFAHRVALLGVLLLAADALVEVVRARRSRS